MTQPLVIIGSGLGGYMLAKEFRKIDSEKPVTIITADDGAFYSKPLLSTALTNNKTCANLAVNSAAEMAEQLNAEVVTNTEVTEIDIQQRVVRNNEQYEFSHLVLACGAHKIKPQLDGDAVDDIMSVNNLQEYAKFRAWLEGKKQIAVLGAGLVGCEFTNDMMNNGLQVHVIAPEQHPLASLVPDAIGHRLIAGLQVKGVTWHLGHLATEVNHQAEKYHVTLSNGDELVVDGVFAAIGLRPNLTLAKTANLKTAHGIVVNRWLQTNERNIFALGDCAEVEGLVQMYVAPLLQCARALAQVLAGGKDPVYYPCMPVVIKTPACPVVSSPPPRDVSGEWVYEGEGDHLSALFHDAEGQLRGFALVGEKVRDRMKLAKQLPLVFSD